MTSMHKTAAVLALAACLTATGCSKDKKQEPAKDKPAASEKAAKDNAGAAARDPYEDTKKDAELDKSLDAITEDSANTDKAKSAAPKDDPKTLAKKDELIKKLLPAMNVDRQIDMLREMFAQDTAQIFIEQIQQRALEKGLATEENGKILNENLPGYVEKLMSCSARLVDAKEIKDSILAPAYREQYTVEELQGMLDFFSSPAGKAYLEQNPAINQTLHEILIKTKSDKVNALVDELAGAALADLKPGAKTPKGK